MKIRSTMSWICIGDASSFCQEVYRQRILIARPRRKLSAVASMLSHGGESHRAFSTRQRHGDGAMRWWRWWAIAAFIDIDVDAIASAKEVHGYRPRSSISPCGEWSSIARSWRDLRPPDCREALLTWPRKSPWSILTISASRYEWICRNGSVNVIK